MGRQTYLFSFTDWFAVPDGHGCIDWDCDFLALILLPDGTVCTRPFNSQFHHERVASEFPDAVRLGELSRHRDKFEDGPTSRLLRDRHPDLYADLNRWTPFKEAARAPQA